MAPRKRKATTAATTAITTTPTRNTRRRISTQRQREAEQTSKNNTRKLSALAEQAEVLAENEATSAAQQESGEIRCQEEEVGRDDSPKNVDASDDQDGEDVEGGEKDRGVGDDRPIPEETGTSDPAESSPARPADDDTSLIKLFRYSDYKFVTKMDEHPNLTGGVTVKSGLGKSFSEFRKILKQQKLEKFFKYSIFGKYLDLPEKIVIRFQMTMVYELLRRRINSKRIEEIWINFCGMPVCFVMREFAIVTGLNCHLPEEYDTGKISSKVQRRRQEIIQSVGRTFKEEELIEHLKSDDVSRSVKKSLCLVYFVHCVLLGRDRNTKIPVEYVLLSADRKVFCVYPWGRESYELTVKYLLMAVNKDVKTTNLYGFPWAFMCWAFEAIPHLRKKLKMFSEQVSSPRIIRWISAVNNTSVEAHDLFDPPEDSIVHPWIVPTLSEMEMDFLTRFVPLKLTKDDEIKKLERDLNGFVAIKRDNTVVEKDFDPSMALVIGGDVLGESSRGVGDGDGGGGSSPNIERDFTDAGVGGGGGVSSPHVDVGGGSVGVGVGGGGGYSPFVPSVFGHGGGGGFSPTSEHARGPQTTPFTTGKSSTGGVGTSKVPLCSCQCDICAGKINLMIESIRSLEENVKSWMAKRGVRPSRKVSGPYTPIRINKRRKQILKAIESAKGKRAAKTPTVMPIIERQSVDIYKHAKNDSIKKIKAILKAKDPRKKPYTMHDFNFEDFAMMVDMHRWWEDRHVDEVLCLMRQRHIEYPIHYDAKDIILDLDFPNYFMGVYEQLVEESSQPGSVPLNERIDQFIFDDFYLSYCNGVRPFPGGVPWHGAKRIFTVLNLGKKHFVALEILIDEGKINVHDCNRIVYPDERFVGLIMPILELFPRFLRQSKMFDHLPAKFLNDVWNCERLEDAPKK